MVDKLFLSSFLTVKMSVRSFCFSDFFGGDFMVFLVTKARESDRSQSLRKKWVKITQPTATGTRTVFA